ncbi:MAG: response regulator, partial [Longimicrobiaceae bacterium]
YALLLRRAGYGVVEAAHGGDAIRLARERSPDLIILDLGMPVVDGYEAATSLREYRDTAEIPILTITGSEPATSLREYRDTAEIPILTITGSEPAQIPARLAAVCDALVRKPCSCRQILAQVRRLIGPATRKQAS